MNFPLLYNVFHVMQSTSFEIALNTTLILQKAFMKFHSYLSHAGHVQPLFVHDVTRWSSPTQKDDTVNTVNVTSRFT